MGALQAEADQLGAEAGGFWVAVGHLGRLEDSPDEGVENQLGTVEPCSQRAQHLEAAGCRSWWVRVR